jgi:hypothetical protein
LRKKIVFLNFHCLYNYFCTSDPSLVQLKWWSVIITIIDNERPNNTRQYICLLHETHEGTYNYQVKKYNENKTSQQQILHLNILGLPLWFMNLHNLSFIHFSIYFFWNQRMFMIPMDKKYNLQTSTFTFVFFQHWIPVILKIIYITLWIYIILNLEFSQKWIATLLLWLCRSRRTHWS